MNCEDVANRVKRQFGDESGAQLTDADIIRWINEAQREAVVQNEGLLEDTLFIDTVEGTDTYSLSSTLYALHSLYYRDSTTTAYYVLRYFNLNEFNAHVDGWDDSDLRGSPVIFTEVEDQVILFPNPDRSVTNGLKYIFSRYPTDVTGLTSGDTLDLPAYYHQFVVNYCLMQAAEMDEDYAQADRKAGVVQADLDFSVARKNQFGRDTYPVIREMPEDLY